MKKFYIITIVLFFVLLGCSKENSNPLQPEKTYRYGKDLGKITFWTTWSGVSYNSINIRIYNTNNQVVKEGFLSQFYNYGTEPKCDDNTYGATAPFILPTGTYTYIANTSNGYHWEDEFIIKEDVCLRYLLYVK